MDHQRREFLQNGVLSLSALSTLAFLEGGCTCQQRNDGSTSQSTCCSTPELEAESLFIGEDSLLIDLEKAPSLRHVGNAAYIIDAKKEIQIIVVRAGKETYYALHRLCTHANQVVSYNRKRDILQCNGYNHSIFALNGDLVKGPAPKPLKSYAVTLTEGKLVISLV